MPVYIFRPPLFTFMNVTDNAIKMLSALIHRKLPHRFQHLGRYSNPDAAWPGSLLDKLRLCMDYDLPQVDGQGRPLLNRDSNLYEGLGTGLYNGRGHAVFRPAVSQNKRAYPGYNNDLLTWPIGENGVRYGTIDEHRVVR